MLGSEMDGEELVSWSKLPDEVVAKIQARLPLVSLVRSRAVCKAWDAAVESPRLLQERLDSRAGDREWMLFVAGFCEPGDGNALASCAYDPASDRWYQLHLPPWLRSQLPDATSGLLELTPASPGGGVLLGSLCSQPNHEQPGGMEMVFLHMGNPVLQSWACLPPFPDPDLRIWHVRGLLVDAAAGCFKLVALNDERLHLADVVQTFVFDSALGSWSVTSSPIPDCGDFHFFLGEQQGVFVGTVLYCLTPDSNLVVYDLEGANPRWSWLAVGKPPYVLHVFCCNLVNVRDRLLCVAVVPDVSHEFCLQIWEMDLACMTWREVDAMPGPMFSHFRGQGRSRSDLSFLDMKAVAGQDHVFIMQDKVDRIVAFDLRHSPAAAAWSWLPSLPYKDFVRKSLQCFDPLLQVGTWIKDRVAPNRLEEG